MSEAGARILIVEDEDKIADVLRENVPMRALINRYRAVVQPSGDPRIVRYRVDI